MYQDRIDAGQQLARYLAEYGGRRALVLAIPRGGVPVAAEIAQALDAELDVIVARKLGAPGAPELAIGAVTSNDGRFLNASLIRELGISESYLEAITASERAEAQRREIIFRGQRPAPAIAGRVVIVVDDGLATGATMRAAVRSVRQSAPSRLVIAVPVGSVDSCESLRLEVDEVVCPSRPKPFRAVGHHYARFPAIEDAEVRHILEAAWAGRRVGPATSNHSNSDLEARQDAI